MQDDNTNTAYNELNPYIQGIFAPTHEETTILDCEVVGEIPSDLYGAYVRNGPNPQKAPQDMHHWFDGDGMVHAMYFENGKAEYRNRYVRNKDFMADQQGTLDAGGVMRPANPEHPPRGYKDTANTDVVQHAGSLLSTWYICGTPVRLNTRTLETLGEERFNNALSGEVSAHTKVDNQTGEMMFFSYALYEPWMSTGVVDKDNNLTNFQTVDLPGPRLPHDMAVTENYSILHDLPVTFTEKGLRNRMWSIEFNHDLPTRFGVIPRHGTSANIRWFECEPCYIYHVANAWEEGNEIVMHACHMKPAGGKPNPDYGPYGPMVTVLKLHAAMCEWRLNMRTGKVTTRPLDDNFSEFPCINLDYMGHKTDFAYSMSIAPTEIFKFNGIYKYDLNDGSHKLHRLEPGVYASEASFAPAIDSKAEDDGYLVFFTHNENTHESEVRILDAREPEREELARVKLPKQVPVGFHATWARGDQIVT